MAIPVVLAVIAGVSAIAGVANGAHGAKKMKDASDTMKVAKVNQKHAEENFINCNDSCIKTMDNLGKQELDILNSFEEFSDYMERLQGRPEFKSYKNDGVSISKYNPDEIKKVSAGAAILLGGIVGSAAGTASGFAAAGAATSAIMAFGTASTGTAIASLSGAAATNATLAALGGGAIGSAAGAGGMALGSTMLGVSTAGIGIMVGGIVFNITGCKLSKKADDAYKESIKIKEESDKICDYLSKLDKYARDYIKSISVVENKYRKNLQILDHIMNYEKKTNWKRFSKKDKEVVEQTVLLVGLLFKMCQVKLVLKDKKNKDQNVVNVKGIMDMCSESDRIMESIAA